MDHTARGLEVADVIKVANRLTVRSGRSPNHPGQPHTIARVLESDREGQRSQNQRDGIRRKARPGSAGFGAKRP